MAALPPRNRASDLEPPRGCKNHESMDKNQQQEEEQQQTIEVGSEILLPKGSSPTDDNVRQKLDSGAIFVHGKEELPFICCENNELSPHHHHPSQPPSLRSNERRRGRSRSLVNEKTTATLLMNNDNNSQENIFYLERNENENEVETDTNSKDNNANAKITRTHYPERSATLPRRRRRRAYSGCVTGNLLPPHRVTPDGTAIYYWCELPRRPGSQELDDGAYNPLWTMRGFTQTFHFWKETKRAQSVPLNAFLTYITLPWWSIAKDILDHREGPILTF